MKQDVTKVLQEKADQVFAGAEIIAAKTRDWQIIKAYLSGRLQDIQLTALQEKKLERYQYIYNQLVSGKYTEQDVVNQVKNLYKIESVQAYEDLKASKEIFISVLNINKRFEQKMELESAKKLKIKCEELQDFKAAAAIQKNIVNLLKDLPEEDENPSELFTGHLIEAVFDPRLLGAPAIDMKELSRVINDKRKVKINIDMFEEISFEETPNGEAAAL